MIFLLLFPQLVTKVSIHHFAANSEDEMDEWLSAFQAVAFKDNVSRQTVEEDNDLYCSSGDGNGNPYKLFSRAGGKKWIKKPQETDGEKIDYSVVWQLRVLCECCVPLGLPKT